VTAKRLIKYFLKTAVTIAALAFIVKFAGNSILKQYISYGIGSCKTSPILCMEPEESIVEPKIDTAYRQTLVPQNFPKMSISVPRGFDLVQELIKKPYYKRRRTRNKAIIYLLIQEPGSFIKLYPDVKKQGVKDDYEFISRLMRAQLDRIENVTDAFFVVMKSIFIPDIGNPGTAKMIQFRTEEMKGFINYQLSKPNNYFDCNVFDSRGVFFKVYIRDIGAHLGLNDVFAIISTLKPVD
jgi:hypothetical protein